MANVEKIIRLLHKLLAPAEIDRAQNELAQALGACNLLLFLRDPTVDILLPAPGFPQTLPSAKSWHSFLKTVKPGKNRSCELKSPWTQTLISCRAAASWDGSVAVLLGGSPDEEGFSQLITFLPVVIRGLQIRMEGRIAAAELQESRIAVQRAAVFAQSLDTLRRDLQTALDDSLKERQKAEAAGAEILRINIELQAARDIAIEANRAKSSFLAHMSHELRTPLNAIIGYAEMIKDESDNGNYSSLTSDIVKIRDSGRHLMELVTNILDLSKIEAGKLELELSHFRIGSVLEEVANIIEPLAQQRENVVVVDQQPSIIEMYTDRGKLRQVLVNLASNAVKFTRNGKIGLRASLEKEPGEQVRFDISDTGLGMHPDQLDRLFKEFSQLHSGRNGPQTGTGLGLAISQKLCEMMGGRITVKTKIGQGSTFSVIFPINA